MHVLAVTYVVGFVPLSAFAAGIADRAAGYPWAKPWFLVEAFVAGPAAARSTF